MPSEELLHAKLPFFILEEESFIYLWALVLSSQDVKNLGVLQHPQAPTCLRPCQMVSTGRVSSSGGGGGGGGETGGSFPPPPPRI